MIDNGANFLMFLLLDMVIYLQAGRENVIVPVPVCCQQFTPECDKVKAKNIYECYDFGLLHI